LRATAGSAAIPHIIYIEKRKTIFQNLKLRERRQKAEDKIVSSIKHITKKKITNSVYKFIIIYRVSGYVTNKTLPFINTRIHAKIQKKYQDKGHTTF
jgi:hypothetical protein